MAKVIVDEWSDRVQLGDVLMTRTGNWVEVVELMPTKEDFQIGVVCEGGDIEEDYDAHPAWFLNCKVMEGPKA